MATGILQKKLPPNMKSDFWRDFIDCIEEESEEYKLLISKKLYTYDIDKMDYERLLEVADLLNVPFDVSVIGTEDFLRSEIKSIPFRIKYKATAKLYLSFLLAMERKGFLYLYYWNGSNLIRHSYNLLSNINGVDPSLPYGLPSKMNFSSFISESLLLDSGLTLDDSPTWILDNRSSKANTKHLCLEIMCDRVFYGEEVGLAPSNNLAPSNLLAPVTKIPYLMRPKYFSYLKTNMEISKKVTEVIHIGAQLIVIGDNSRYYDSLGLQYTMPQIQTNVVTTNNMTSITSVADMKYIVFGVDKWVYLPSQVNHNGTMPTALREKIAKIPILIDEKWEDSNWYGVNATYIGNLVNDLVIGTGNGSQTLFTYSLPYFPIKPGNVKVSFTSNLIEYTVEDDFHGNMLGSNAEGTINYETGEITINTDFYQFAQESIGTGTGAQLVFNKTLSATNIPVKTGSFSVSYIINGTTLIAVDNGSGIISGNSCTGTINYSSGAIQLTFAIAPSNDTNILASFKHEIITIPTNGSSIKIEYYFVGGGTEISEAGILDASGNLLAYAAFPKVNFNSFDNHLNMSFIIKKSNFV